MSAKNIDSTFYADTTHLQQYKSRNDQKSLSYAAKEFESLYLQMLLKSMREAGQAFGSSMGTNHYISQYQSMYDSQLANHIAHHGGIGMADSINKQLASYVGKPPTEENAAQEHTLNISSLIGKKLAPNINKNITLQQIDTFAEFTTPREFIDKLTPLVTSAANELGIAPELLLAQAALESGWGQHTLDSRNLFGIKADSTWQKTKSFVNTKTHEFLNGVKSSVVDKFRSYKSYQESVTDYVSFVKNNPRYQQALSVAAHPEQYMRELQKAGYATDPHYADKVLNIYNKIGMNAK